MIGFGERVSDPIGSGTVLAFALAFYVLGCVLLILTGGTLGTLHAFAAFIVLAIVAALNQLLPVLTHAPVANPRVVLAVAAAFAIGFALLIAGFYNAPTFLAAAIVLSATALFWVAWNIVRLRSGKEEGQTRSLMLCAVLAFIVVAGVGATMAGALAGSWSAPLGILAPLHAVLAILGFASLLIVAISYRFVPMFAVAHGTAYGRHRMQWIVVAGVVVAALFLRSSIGLRIGLFAVLVGAVSIGVSHAKTLTTRLRRRLDVSLRYGAVAWSLGIAALALAIASTWNDTLWSSAVTLGLLGWITITILGYAYKVAGFLAWQTAKDRDPSAQLPALSTAVTLPLAYTALTLLGIGAAVSTICTVVEPDHLRVGYGVYAAGGFLAVAALTQLASRYVLRNQHDGTTARAPG